MSASMKAVSLDSPKAQNAQVDAKAKADMFTLERETMGSPWLERLDHALNQASFAKLKAFLAAEVKGGKIVFPPANDVYTWSRYPRRGPGAVRVVLVGQDPYHGPGQACGLSFSVGPGVAIPPSLRNIYKEISNEYPPTGQRESTDSARPELLNKFGFTPPSHGSLIGWAEQGVLLLNACLTVRAYQAGSHHNQGWEPFTRAILEVLANEAKNAHPALGNTTENASSRSHPANAPNTSSTSQSCPTAGNASQLKRKSPPKGNPTLEQMFSRAKRSKPTEVKPAKTGDVLQNLQSEEGQGQDENILKSADKRQKDESPESGADGGPEDVCRGIVFLAWGSQASKILADAGITDKTPNTLILRSAHPSPLSAHRGFFNNGHFRRANHFLVSRYGPEGAIDWGYLPAPVDKKGRAK